MGHRLTSRLLIGAAALPRTLRHHVRRPPELPRRVLIAHHLLLGDTLMLTPLLAKLHQYHPQAELVMTAPKAIAPLYAHRPYGVSVMPYDPRDVRTLSTLMQRSGYDLALIPGDNRFSWTAYALGAGWIRAFSGDYPAYKNWLVDELIDYRDTPSSWGDMCTDLISGPAPAPYQPDDWQAPNFSPFTLPEQDYCVLHPGASTVLKQWPAEQWRALAQHLQSKGLTIVWSAGPGEQALIQAIDPQAQYISYAGQLDLAQLWQLIKQARLLVCPDTGVAHIGRLTHTATVTLFGPGSAQICGQGDFWQNAPYRAVYVQDIPCRDQQVLFRRQLDWVRRCGRSSAQCAQPVCMQRIALDPVRQAIDSVLNHR